MSTIYYWENLTFSKLRFLEGKFEEQKGLRSFEEQKVQGIFGETFISALSSSAAFPLQIYFSDFFKFVLLWG